MYVGCDELEHRLRTVHFGGAPARRHSAALGLHLDRRASSPTYRRCMLGLRPRLRPRPSFLDLVRKTDSEEQLPPRPSTSHETGIDPRLVPLPKSPVLPPQNDQDDVETPPSYSPVDVVKQEEKVDKMTPVSDWLGGALRWTMADDGGVAETAKQGRR